MLHLYRKRKVAVKRKNVILNLMDSSEKKVYLHAVLLGSAVLMTFFWVNNNLLINYSLQLSGVLMIILIVSRHLLKPLSFRLAESTISTISVLLICASTGGLSSPLFFLNYFLLFELSLLLEPAIAVVLSLLLIVFYFFSHQVGSSLIYLVELLAFPFMTPLAFLFGKIYLKEENQKKEIKNLSKKIEKLEEELIEEELEKA